MAHSQRRYPTRSTDFYDVLEAIAKSQENLEPEDRIAIAVTKNGDHSWNKEMPETRFTLGERTVEYYEKKVAPFGKTEIPFYDLLADSRKSANFNYMWFDFPQCGSMLGCGSRILHFGNNALVVLVKTAEGGSRTTSGYDLTTIEKCEL